MANLSVSLEVWKENHAVARVLQGESGSRTLTVTFLDSGGQPVNLAGCTPRMYLADSNPPVFTDGAVADADGGTAKFVIPPEMTADRGIHSCQFLLAGPDFPPLKADGLTLHVTASSLESAVEATGEYSALVTALNKADTAAERADTAAWNAEDAISGQLVPAVDARIAAKTNVTDGVMGYDDAHAHIADDGIHVTAAQKAAWTAKADKSTTVNGHALTDNVTVTKADVGLGSADNTADADKSVGHAATAGSADNASDTQSVAGALTLSTAEPADALAEGKLWGVYGTP